MGDPEKRPDDSGCVRDDIRIQEWMIWSIPGIQEYAVRDGAYTIRNGVHSFNRPLFGPPGAILPFTGDRPQWLLAEIGRHKLGILSLAVGDRWLHQAAEVESTYDAGRMRHVVRDPALGGSSLILTTLRLPASSLAEAGASGCIVRLEAEEPVEVRWVFGGLRPGFDTDWAGSGGWPGGLHPDDALSNRVEVRDSAALLTDPAIPDRVVAVSSGLEPHLMTLAYQPPGTRLAAAPSDRPAAAGTLLVGPQPSFLVMAAGQVAPDAGRLAAGGADLWSQAEDAWRARAERLVVHTPVPELDAAARSNNTALDGIWRPPSYLHGAVRWGADGWYLGWRGWYGPLCAGDAGRVRQAIRFHAAHQVGEPAAGVQSRGAFHAFIAFDGTPHRCSYDMNQVFLDHIRAYFAWTGDLETIREIWPAVKRCLEYERREMDPDGDGLYTNNLNTWVSDGHHYNGGGCTQASAYMYRAFLFAADVAGRLGEDPVPYRAEAARIRSAVQRSLWMEAEGYFAEYVDRDGLRHTAAEAPSVYHPIEFGLADPLQAIRATQYLTDRLWRFGDQILVNDWFPVIVTNGCLAHNETLNSAIAYFAAGDVERGWRLLHTVTRAFRRAAVPGSVSCYAGTEGEQGVYVDFADAVSLFTRCVVEGLFGLQPDVPAGRVEWSPRFPHEWPRASLRTAGYSLSYERSGTSERYVLETPCELAVVFTVPLRFDRLKSVKLNGRSASYQGQAGLHRPRLVVRCRPTRKAVLEMTYSGRMRFGVSDPPPWVTAGDAVSMSVSSSAFAGIADPERALRGLRLQGRRIEARAGDPGEYRFLARISLPHGEALHPVQLEVRPPYELVEARLCVPRTTPSSPWLELVMRANRRERVPPPLEVLYAGRTYRTRMERASGGPPNPGEPVTLRIPIEDPERLTPGGLPVRVTVRGQSSPVMLCGETRLWSLFSAWPEAAAAFRERCIPLDIPRNDRLEALFARDDAGPDEPFLNCWTWYERGTITLDHVRSSLRDGLFTTDVGVPFRVPAEGNNVLCATRWRTHPDAVAVPVGRRAEKIYLLLANTTQNSQTHLPQARVTIEYEEGETEEVLLHGPEDVDHMLQHYAVRNYPQWIGGERGGYYGHGRASGAHADVVDVSPEGRDVIERLRIECLTRETLIGVLGVTLL